MTVLAVYFRFSLIGTRSILIKEYLRVLDLGVPHLIALL
jgi:hypothetical protein